MASSYSLGPHFEGLVKRLLDSGRYANASEVVRDGLRLLEQREAVQQARLEGLRKDIDAGLEGPFEPWDVADVKAEARRRKAALKAGSRGA
ncbi:hypothetical protein GCM10007301_26950 [Azorhizobium oxalatiphilum]|uniref:Type II toxin-antitoxin system ParD family antitoxin n=1 Tax=Azorhizobium oxalatiphilum TaxID=980631 RepID=A0A917C1A6_9HYPH|nr:type II toxin-antitoxin system ParD family antitoxin [Azorhizobium oxalatiphilum]GGF65868.1 hypothetical protein GCM10007301_26950 [Azorhizobium oxalatiphilum]